MGEPGIAARVLAGAALRFNPYHAPAGSATGGQFAPSSGGSSSAGKGKAAARPTPTNARPVGHGETGKRVSDLQSRLNALGAKPPLKLDGIFGPKTLAAVRAFQRTHRDAQGNPLKVDGLVGPKTTAALRLKTHPAAKHHAAHHHAAHHHAAKGHTVKHPAAPAKPAKPVQAKPASAKPVQAKAAPAVHRSDAVRESDLKYGHGSALWTYWTRGEGFAKWSGAVHKWTTLHALLLKAGVPAASADGLTTNIITAVMPGYMKQAHAENKAGRATVETTQRAEMTSASINDLPDSEFAWIEPGGKKDASGKTIPRSKRHFPVHDAPHVRNALARAPQSPHGGKAMPKIKARAKKFGVEVSDDSSSSSSSSKASASRMELFRSYPLEDAHVVTRGEGDGSGRLVEAYCAVFGEPAEIMDHQGHYEEDIHGAAFNKRIADVQRSRAGFGLVKVIYNHGMTLHGTPAERFSLPPAVCKHISAEGRGVLTRSYYLDTPLGNELLEMWREGAITAQSFTGAIIRSSPELRRGEKHRPRDGRLTRVTRLELGLKEYGATPFPAYTGAELVGVRMSPLGTWQAADGPEEEEQALPPDGEAAADEPLPLEESHSQRYHQHALYVLRSAELREECGLVL